MQPRKFVLKCAGIHGKRGDVVEMAMDPDKMTARQKALYKPYVEPEVRRLEVATPGDDDKSGGGEPTVPELKAIIQATEDPEVIKLHAQDERKGVRDAAEKRAAALGIELGGDGKEGAGE